MQTLELHTILLHLAIILLFARITGDIFDNFIYASIIFVVAITTLVAPFVLKLMWKE